MHPYFNKIKYSLGYVSFPYLEGYYKGKGTLEWDPELGFHFDALVERDRPNPEKIKFLMMTKRVVRSSDLTTFKMRTHIYDYAYAWKIPLYDEFHLIHSGHLEMVLGKMLFINKSKMTLHDDNYQINCLYETSKIRIPIYPTMVNRTLTVGDVNIETFHEPGGLVFESDQMKVVGYSTDEKYFVVNATFSKSHFKKIYPWQWAQAFETTLSIYLGRSVHLLYREFLRDKSVFTEFRRKQNVIDLNLFRLLDEGLCFPAERLIKFTHFLCSKSNESEISKKILKQMIAAVQAPNRQIRELLIATALEAIFRNVMGKPFKKNGKSISMQNLMSSFCRQYFSGEWEAICQEMVSLQKDLRDRNAHPDWMYHSDSSVAEREIAKSLNDSIQLSRFYGYIILAFSGLNVTPKFPIRTDEN